MLHQSWEKWERCQPQEEAEDHNAVSKQPNMKMMLTEKRIWSSWWCIKLAKDEADANKNQTRLKSVVGIREEFCPDDAAFFQDCPVINRRKLQNDTAWVCRGGGNHIHARMTLHGLNRSGHPACSVPSALPTLHRFYECRYADDNHRWSRYFTNLLYPNRMALGFFTVSFPGESMTLSLVTLAQYYPSKIPIFDAKPLISEVVTLSLLCFSSANHLLSQSRRRILNVTESDIT